MYYQVTLKYQHHLTKQKLKVNSIDGTKVRRQCLSIHEKKKIKLRQSANSQSAWAKIKLLVDAAGLAKSIRHQKDEIKYLNDTSKQVKDGDQLLKLVHIFKILTNY